MDKVLELNNLLEEFLNNKKEEVKEDTRKSKKSKKPGSVKTATASVVPFPTPTTP